MGKKEMSGQYKGDATPEEAWNALSEDPNSVLVDVRTLAEWKCVGTTNLSSLEKQDIQIEWVNFPDGIANVKFIEELESSVTDKGTPVYFLCRTGVRSVGAAIAATEAGYGNSFNIVEGFEGSPDEEGHRGRISGWQGRGLPWKH